MELDELPEHLLVLGGGYIGLEFGQMFRRFGSEVTIVQRTGQLLGRERSGCGGRGSSGYERGRHRDTAQHRSDSRPKDGTQIELSVRTAER